MTQPAALPRPPRLTLRFALYAGVALALAGAASIWIGSRQATGDEQRAVWEDARYVAERLGKDDLARSALERPAAGDRRAELDELFDREALGPQANAVTLFRRDGRVTYSTDHTLIGTIHADRAELDRALAGTPVYGVADSRGKQVLESYVPVHWVLADPTWASGVLRVSRDYEPVQEAISDSFKLQAATTLLALVLLYLSLFPILRRVTRTLAQRNRSLAASEAGWRALTEEASDAILVLDGDARVLQANDRAASLLGRAVAADVVGRGFEELVAADELARVPLRLQELAAGRHVLQERRLARPDGSLVVAEISSRMLADGRILAIARDVSERNALELERRRAHRAEATERLAGGIARDFDRLIASISANVDEALSRLSLSDGLRDQLWEIRAASARGAELTQQLLVFANREDAEPPAAEASPLEPARETILVAEDEHVVRALVREILESRDFTVLDAGSGVEALEVARAHGGPIDLLLTDVVMPDKGGPELSRELLREHPDCAVVFMSGYSEEPPAPGALFLEKPFTHESLAQTVRRVLDARAVAAAAAAA